MNIESRNKHGCTLLSRNYYANYRSIINIYFWHLKDLHVSKEACKLYEQYVFYIYVYIFTAFTVTFYHILHQAGNQQKNLHPVFKSIILISRDNISLQSWQNVFRTLMEIIDTIDKVSVWDQLLNSQLLTLLCNWLRYCSKPSRQCMYKLIWYLLTVFNKINNTSPMLIPNNH